MANPEETKLLSAGLYCIDLLHPNIDQLKRACKDSGFFYLINHGISEELMDEVFTKSKRFFALPMNEKLKLVNQKKYRGYDGPAQEGHGETYRIGAEVPEDDPDAGKPYYGRNVWPSADVLPGWKETMQSYQREALNLGREVARMIAIALDLDVDFFEQPEMLGNAISSLYLLHYQAHAIGSSKELLGLQPHSDLCLITLLATDDALGLQICKDKDIEPQAWEYVPPLKGAYIVNIGDMLERLSNCAFRSSMHRVVNRLERYAISFFIFPSPDGVLECLPTCKSVENPPKFPSIKCEEFLNLRFKKG